MNVKKILALVLATMMVLGTVSALAADPRPTTFDIPITQTLYFKNAEGSSVYEPNLYYTYTITPGAAGKTVRDHAGNAVSVKAGDMRGFGLTTATGTVNFGINFSSDHKPVAADKDGKAAVTKKVTVTFDGSKILADGVVTPGVYRYIITQTTTPDQKKAVGVTELGTVDKTLVLDVYVQNDGHVPGAVIIDPDKGDDPSIDNSDIDNNPDTPGTDPDDKNGKTEGFGDPDKPGDDFEKENPADTTEDDPNKPAGDEDDPTTQMTKFTANTAEPTNCDLYVTYNVTITKEVTGNMGDKSNFFPFKTDVSNSIHGAAFTYSVTDNGGKNKDAAKVQLIAGGLKTLGATSATVSDGLEIKNGGKINLIGVPSSTSAEVSILANEYNNTADQYKVSSTDFGDGAEANLDKEKTSAFTTAKSFKDDTANTTFKVTNKLDDISPTGVVLRFAPYAMMLGAGLCLILLAMKRRKSDEEV